MSTDDEISDYTGLKVIQRCLPYRGWARLVPWAAEPHRCALCDEPCRSVKKKNEWCARCCDGVRQFQAAMGRMRERCHLPDSEESRAARVERYAARAEVGLPLFPEES